MKFLPTNQTDPIRMVLPAALAVAVLTLLGVSGCSGDTPSEEGGAQTDALANQSTGDNTQTEQSQIDVTTDSLDNILSLEDISKIKSGFAQSVVLHNLLDRSDESDLLGLLEESKTIAHTSLRNTMQTTILRKFASINPKAAVSHASKLPRFQQDTLIAAIFGEWSYLRLKQAVDHAKTLNSSRKFSALRGILEVRDDLSEDLRREIAREIGNEQLAIDLIAQSKLAESIENPEQAWNSLLSDDIGDVAQASMLIQVAEAWLDKIGLSALDRINGTLTDWQVRMSVLNSIIHRLAQSDPEGTFEHVKGMQNDQNNYLLMTVVRAWAGSDPEAAFEATSLLEQDILRRTMLATVVQVWATNDPHFILDNIEMLPEESREMGRSQAIHAIAREDPEEAALLLAGMDLSPSNYSVAYTIVSNWLAKDREAALDWVLNNPEIKDLRQMLLSTVLGTLAQDDPQRAMEIALSQPIGESNTGLEVSVLSFVSYSDVQRALELLPQVREGPTKLSAYTVVGGAMIRNGNADGALKLASQFSEPDRSAYYRSIVGSWAAADAKSLYDRIDELPSSALKSSAAVSLISWNRWQKRLSPEQLESAKKYLSEEDAKNIENQGNSNRTFGAEGVMYMPMPATSSN